MKIIGNTVGMGLPKPDLKQTDPKKGDYVKGKDAIPTKPEDIGALPDTYTPPNQTAEQVGADPKGTAEVAVSQHNSDTDAHGDIRLELKAINDRLTAFFDSDDQTLDELSEIVAYITGNKTLIESITTSKVNVVDIINNLTTNVTNKPLSAAQGVVLKGLIDTVSNSLANYALASAVPTKVSQLQNDKGYLTEHQDISGKLDASALPTAINGALAQAKESGAFDGATGQRGTGLLAVTTAPSSYTTAVGGITPEYRMALSTIKTQAGVTEVLLGDTVRYSYYHYPIDYLDASYAYFTERVSIRGATGVAGADGYTPVKGVDYFDGTNGRDGVPGDDGYTPVKGVDYYTDADKAEFSEYIASELAKRGQLEPLYANSIEECTDTTKLYVLPDGYIYAYMMKETVGGAGYTNLVPTSIDTDGSIYNGTGYKDNARLSSSGGVSGSAQTGSVVAGFMPWQSNGVIRIKGARFETRSGEHFYLSFYNSNKTLVSTYTYVTPADNNVKYAYSYDETTGVTTIDFSGVTTTVEWTAGIVNGVYFRINAYGKGADLIITVNEEIKEATSTISYTWENTGHAFVPADYEDRIVALESNTNENTEDIAILQQQVDNILDGTTQIAASTKFDPTVYDLPVLYLTGDTSPIAVSKDNKVTLEYSYGDLSGTCTLKGQGATSYKMAKAFIDQGKAGKFNYTIKFDTAFEVVEGWGAQQKYCLKANWIDHTHSRNVVSCKLWGMSVKARSTVPTELANLPNGGAIDGFPIIIMLNGEFHGLYTWNIPKDGWMFGLAEDASKTQAIVGADDHTAATQFKEASMSGYEVEFVSDEDNAAWVESSMKQMISAVMNSNGSDLDTVVAQYLDLDSVIDHYIHTVVDKATDCVDKNFLLVTFDGVKWYMSAYDRDSIHGLNWDATGTTRPVSNVSFVECAASVKAYELIKNFKTDALKARYNQLRGNILSESRIMEKFENFAWAIPSTVLVEDVKKYPTIRGSSVNTIDQIGRFVRQRLEKCDEWIAAL